MSLTFRLYKARVDPVKEQYSMASLKKSKRALFAEDDAFARDPGTGSCTCGNIWNRVEKRGACPCLKAGRFCSASCRCGSKKRACTNKPGVRGSVLSAELGITPLAAATDQREVCHCTVLLRLSPS